MIYWRKSSLNHMVLHKKMAVHFLLTERHTCSKQGDVLIIDDKYVTIIITKVQYIDRYFWKDFVEGIFRPFEMDR